MCKKSLFVGLIGLFCSFQLSAQNHSTPNMAIGGGISTLGPKIEVATSFGNYVALRGGVSYLPLTLNHRYSIDAAKYREYIEYDPDVKITSNINLFHGHLLADFSVIPNGIFHITGGFFLGSSKITGSGILINPSNNSPVVEDLRNKGYVQDELPSIEIETDYELQPDRNGQLNADIRLGKTIKPYLGLGIGRAVPKGRFGINFDIGVIYQGDVDVSSKNMKRGSLNEFIKTQKPYNEYLEYAKWYPFVNLQCAIRIL